MKSFRSASSLLMIIALATILCIPSSRYSAALAAPVSSSSSSSDITTTPECRKCLSEELHNIKTCDKLSDNIPAISPSEKDHTKISEYKAKYPEAVSCLCLASSQAQGPQGWVAKCDAVCTVAVEKYQKRVLSSYAKLLSCNTGSGSGSDSPATENPLPPPPPPPAPKTATKAKPAGDRAKSQTREPSSKPKNQAPATTDDEDVEN